MRAVPEKLTAIPRIRYRPPEALVYDAATIRQ